MWCHTCGQMSPMMQCGCHQQRPAYNMRKCCRYPRRNYGSNSFVLIVVLFILLIIVGVQFRY